MVCWRHQTSGVSRDKWVRNWSSRVNQGYNWKCQPAWLYHLPRNQCFSTRGQSEKFLKRPLHMPKALTRDPLSCKITSRLRVTWPFNSHKNVYKLSFPSSPNSRLPSSGTRNELQHLHAWSTSQDLLKWHDLDSIDHHTKHHLRCHLHRRLKELVNNCKQPSPSEERKKLLVMKQRLMYIPLSPFRKQ